MMNYLLIEDDQAPDGRSQFSKQLKQRYGLTIDDFRKKGQRFRAEENHVAYEYQGYVLETFADAPFLHLRKSNPDNND